MTSPTRPPCWPSTRRSRLRARVSRAVALPWSPTRCAGWAGAQRTSGEAVLAIGRRGEQLDRWMNMTQAMSAATEKVRPAVQLQYTAAENVQRSIELAALRSRVVAAAAQEIVLAMAGPEKVAGRSENGSRG